MWGICKYDGCKRITSETFDRRLRPVKATMKRYGSVCSKADHNTIGMILEDGMDWVAMTTQCLLGQLIKFWI